MTTINVSSTTGLALGQQIEVDGEVRRIACRHARFSDDNDL